MLKPALNHDEQLVSCEICLKSIPMAESNHAETEDYVAYFCGLDCYELWRNQHQVEDIADNDRVKSVKK